MAAELVYRIAILVAFRRFPRMGAAESRPLRSAIMSACKVWFVDLLMFLFDVLFGGICGENSCNVFMLLFMVLWVLVFATVCRREVLMLWHAFLFFGLWFFPSFLLFAW
jgi:hypothetical protein